MESIHTLHYVLNIYILFQEKNDFEIKKSLQIEDYP